jgi:hypothetical protein
MVILQQNLRQNKFPVPFRIINQNDWVYDIKIYIDEEFLYHFLILDIMYRDQANKKVKLEGSYENLKTNLKKYS